MGLTRDEIQGGIYEFFKDNLPTARLVVNGQWDQPDGDTPVVFVMAAGTEHQTLNREIYKIAHLIALHVLVLDSREDDNYVAEDADLLINTLNEEIVAGFETLMRDDRWQFVEWAIPSGVLPKEKMGGYWYRHELYVFRVFP